MLFAEVFEIQRQHLLHQFGGGAEAVLAAVVLRLVVENVGVKRMAAAENGAAVGSGADVERFGLAVVFHRVVNGGGFD